MLRPFHYSIQPEMYFLVSKNVWASVQQDCEQISETNDLDDLESDKDESLKCTES